MAAYELGFEKMTRGIVEPTNASRQVLKDFLVEHNFQYVLGKGYYAFINVAPWLKAKGWANSEPLGQYLAEQIGVAIVPGVYFSEAGSEWVRFSYATPVEKTLGAAQRLVDGLSALLG